MNKLYEEFKNYQIPNNDIELLDWLAKGDQSATKEGWNFYIRCIFSSVEFARHNAPLRDIFFLMTGKYCTSYTEEEQQCMDYKGDYHTYPAVGVEKFLPCEQELLNFINGTDLSLIEQVRDFTKKFTVPNFEEFYQYENPNLRQHCHPLTKSKLRQYGKTAAKMLNDAIWSAYASINELENRIRSEEKNIEENLNRYISFLEALNPDTFIPNLPQNKETAKFFGITALTKFGRRIQHKRMLANLTQQKTAAEARIEQYKNEIEAYPIGDKLREKVRELLNQLATSKNITTFEDDKAFGAEILLKEPYLRSIIALILTRLDFKLSDYDKIRNKIHCLTTISTHVQLPQLASEEFANEIRSNAYIFQHLFSAEILADNNLESLSTKIRQLMINSKLTNEHGLAVTYRNKKIGTNNGYISGANLTNEEISAKMKKLTERFYSAQQISDLTEYVQVCADIFHDYVRLHPYDDGNGRCSRMLLQVMLAKRGIFIPSLYDTHYDCLRKYQKDNFRYCGDQSIITNDNSHIISYVCNRVNKFYPNLLNQQNPDEDSLPQAKPTSFKYSGPPTTEIFVIETAPNDYTKPHVK